MDKFTYFVYPELTESIHPPNEEVTIEPKEVETEIPRIIVDQVNNSLHYLGNSNLIPTPHLIDPDTGDVLLGVIEFSGVKAIGKYTIRISKDK